MDTYENESTHGETSELPPDNATNNQKPATCINVKETVKEIQNVLEQWFEKLQNATTKSTGEIKEGFKEECKMLQEKTDIANEELSGALKEESVKIQKMVKNSQGEIVEKIRILEGMTENGLKEVKEVMMKELKRCESQLKDDIFRREFNLLLTLKVVLMIVVAVYFCSCKHVSEVKPCELKRTLDSIHLNYTFKPCKHNAFREISITLVTAEVYLNPIIFFVAIGIYFFRLKYKRIKSFLCCALAILAAIALLITVLLYIDFWGKANEHTNIDYGKLQSLLLTWLELHYKSDSISNSDAISSGWNSLFIQYDCCAVREVQGTTNDFDKTPWCTTSGSCQATASQIPKTCCNFVTQDDYKTAPSECHASVNAGTYRPNCMGRIRAMSVDNIDDCVVTMMHMSLLAMLLLQIFEAVILISFAISDVIRCIRSPQKTPNNI